MNTDKNKERMKVVMLPTVIENTHLHRLFRSNLSKSLGYCHCIKTINNRLTLDCSPNFQLHYEDVTPQHLYIVSNKEIKDLDRTDEQIVLLFIASNNSLKVITNSKRRVKTIGEYYEIEASTDKSLGLPLIPEGFVRKYVELNGIDKVMVDMVKNTYHQGPDYFVKIDKENYVTITKIKYSYSRKEVIKLIEDFTMSTYHIPLNKHPEREDAINKWIEENL